MAEVVIFDIDIKGAVDKLAQIRADINAYKEQQKQLTDEVKKGNQEAARSYEANAVIIKNLSAEQRVLSRAVEGAAQVQKKNTDTLNVNNNSIQQNRDLLKQLTAQYINLKNPSTAATNQIKTLSDTLKKQEEAIGNTSRNVGNYKDALKDAVGGINIFGVSLKTLYTTIIANPIGLLVAAVAGLFSILKNNERVVEFFERGLASISAVASELSDLFVNNLEPALIAVKDTLVDAFTKPQLAIGKLVNLIQDNLINRFKALGVIINGIKNGSLERITNGLIQFGTGVEDAGTKLTTFGNRLINVGKDAFDATGALQDLEDNTNKIGLEIEKIETKIADLRGKLRSKDLNERKKAAIEIIRLEDEQFSLKKKQIDDEVAQLQKLAAANTANEEIRKRFEAAQVQQQQVITQLKQAQSSVQTRLNNLLQDEGKIAEKVAEKRKTSLEVATENQQEYINLFLSGLEKELEELDLKQEAQKEKLIEFGETELEIQNRFREERQALIDEYAQDEIDKSNEVSRQLLEQEKDNTAEFKRLKEQQLEAEQTIQDAKAQAISAGFDITRQLVEEDALLAGLLLAAEKAAAIADIIIQNRKANAIVTANASTVPPFIPGTFLPNPAFVIAQTQAATLRAANNVQAGVSIGVIAAQAIGQVASKKFAEGGVIDIDGKPHSQGGENVFVGNRLVANVEGGEGLFVMKKNAYQAISKYSNINKAFGGNSWGETKTHLADGGAINTSIPITDSRNLVQEQITLQNAFRNSVNNLPAPVLSIVEYQNAVSKRNKSVRISEI